MVAGNLLEDWEMRQLAEREQQEMALLERELLRPELPLNTVLSCLELWPPDIIQMSVTACYTASLQIMVLCPDCFANFVHVIWLSAHVPSIGTSESASSYCGGGVANQLCL